MRALFIGLAALVLSSPAQALLCADLEDTIELAETNQYYKSYLDGWLMAMSTALPLVNLLDRRSRSERLYCPGAVADLEASQVTSQEILDLYQAAMTGTEGWRQPMQKLRRDDPENCAAEAIVIASLMWLHPCK